MPYAEYKQFAYAVLHWTYADFCDATVWDIDDAYRGWAALNGVKIAPTMDVEQVRLEMDEMMRRFPDKK